MLLDSKKILIIKKMSYSVTEKRMNGKPIDYLDKNFRNYKYYSSQYYPREFREKSPSLINNRHSLYEYSTFTPIKITKTNSQMNVYNISKNNLIKSYKDLSSPYILEGKVKKKYNPEIFNTELISKPKKCRSLAKIEIPNFKTFLGNKIKTNSININTYNLINCNGNGNSDKLISSSFYKPNINKSIDALRFKKNFNYKKNDLIIESIKLLLEKVNNSSKKAKAKMINQFKQRLIYDKRQNLDEYNRYMKVLEENLSRSKSRSKNKRFNY
jgi:hypothetical protein